MLSDMQQNNLQINADHKNKKPHIASECDHSGFGKSIYKFPNFLKEFNKTKSNKTTWKIL